MSFNEKSTLKQINANDQAKAVLNKYLPGIWEDSKTKMAMSFNLKTMAGFPQAGISPEKLAQIVEELAEIE
ncbi:hypothetical protein [Fusibacter bizertensis]